MIATKQKLIVLTILTLLVLSLNTFVTETQLQEKNNYIISKKAKKGNQLPVVDKEDTTLEFLTFEERLEKYLPFKEYLTVEDVEYAEKRILNFNINKVVTISIDGDWIPFPWWKENLHCQNCHIYLRSNSTDVLYAGGCNYQITTPPKPNQILACACGEARTMNGENFWNSIVPNCNISISHLADSDVWISSSSTFYAPPHWNITRNSISALVSLLLAPPPEDKVKEAPLLFLHSGCTAGNTPRAQIILELLQVDGTLVHSPGNCLHNIDMKELHSENWFWNDSEANRNSRKTEAASKYRTTASMENTYEEDYFTEKRYQALIGGSIPLVFKNNNSLDYLPAPDAAIFYEDFDKDTLRFAEYLTKIRDNDTFYMQHFEWKKRGISRNFVKMLFRSGDFTPCRICEMYSRNEI